MTPDQVEDLLKVIVAWAEPRSDISALAVVGSWARGTAQRESDLDLMLLVDQPSEYREDLAWLSEILWEPAGFRLLSCDDVDYGDVWSRHVQLEPHAELEFSFGARTWASIDPIDSGAVAVVASGCRILLDREGALERFVQRAHAIGAGEA